MKIYHSLALILLVFLSSCASNKATVDYDTSVDFSTFNGYAWLAPSSTAEPTFPLVQQRIHEAIDSSLQAQGLKKISADKADLQVSFQLQIGDSAPSGSGLSVGLGSHGRSTGVGLSMGIPIGGERFEKDTLIINIRQADLQATIWQGTGREHLTRNPSPEDNRDKATALVSEILKQFPPRQ